MQTPSTKVAILSSKDNAVSSKSCEHPVLPDMMKGGGHIASVISLPQIHNLSLILTRQQTNQIEGHFTKYLTGTLQKLQGSKRQGKDQDTIRLEEARGDEQINVR